MYGPSTNAPVNAGDYTVTFAIPETDTTFVGSNSLEFTIAKAASVIDTKPAAINPVYNGMDQVLVAAGTSNDGRIVYSTVQTGDYADTIPTGKDAGRYEVWYKIVGDANHLDSEPACVIVDILKAGVVASPVIQPDNTQFIDALEITITCATDGAAIYYTIDGSEPTVNSSVYTAPFTITANTTIRAFAVKANMDNSAETSKAYTHTTDVPTRAETAMFLRRFCEYREEEDGSN